ncbi:MAG: acyl-CoA dehydrogenase [Legionellaceae bacterium]|nr:acyl-CoA dehydrogenase [Legionellaceae bacterium]
MLLFLAYFLFTLCTLYLNTSAWIWEAGSIFYLFTTLFTPIPLLLRLVLYVVIGSLIALVQFPAIRQRITRIAFHRGKKSIPTLSKTESEALSAGDTWFEADIFCGTPDWQKLSTVHTTLSPEEQDFLNHETNLLCQMLDDWEIELAGDLPPTVWEFLKNKGFFGLVIPKEYGGKGFSARAHSDIVYKISTRSVIAAVTVMVPNSLGPGELLFYYGTEEQKKHYLPSLAQGLDLPCFALTEPNAGSDATSIESEAIVKKRTLDGQEVLGLEIKLNKRWITLAPVATLIGLAVQLKDPEKLLQGVGEEGITCLLIPRDTPNLIIGNRHMPAHHPFMNGTIRGENIFVPINSIIGGQKKAGQGWKMLVECLSIGRSISLPALGAASSAIAYLTTGAYCRVRRQFHSEIGQFEGIQEKLAEIGGLHYLVQATRLLTLAAVNSHKKPSVSSAITKYFNTELSRIAINNAMDIHAGRTVVVGPSNYLSKYYQGIPISVTVEGANIMSRNLLIFGQGSLACHPYIQEEFYALQENDQERFHQAFWKHMQYFTHNMAKTFISSWTGGIFIKTPKTSLKRAYQKFTRLSYTFAWIADLALFSLGGSLKRRERLSARLADALSYLYLAMATLHYCASQQENPDDKLHTQWAVQYCFYHAQKAMIAFCHNFPSRILGRIICFFAFPFGQTMRLPNDALDKKLAQCMMRNNAFRERLKENIFLHTDPHQAIERVENAFQLLTQHETLYQKISDLKRLKFGRLKDALAQKVAQGSLTQNEMDILVSIESARWDAEQVDEFAIDAFSHPYVSSLREEMKNPVE